MASLAIVLAPVAIWEFTLPVERFVRVHSDSYRSWKKLDRCLDWGGSFNRATEECTPSFRWFCEIRRSVWNERMLWCDDLPAPTNSSAIESPRVSGTAAK